MKIAFLNIENLFFRHTDLCEDFKKSGMPWLSEMDHLMAKVHKGTKELHRMEELSLLLGFHRVHKTRYGEITNRKGFLFYREGIDKQSLSAKPETNWNGWIRIKNKPIHLEAISHKIRLLAEVNADVVVLQETD